MLQQTQVATVLPRFASWFERFPDIATLAAASLDDVLKAWEGLGYYRRARFIHAAAQYIVAQHHGQFPHVFDDILKLPGIGRSTAGAIASICFGAATPVLDGNVKRVLKCWYGEQQVSDKQLWSWAQEALDDSDDAATWNQAMMELGACICSPRTQDCNHCPVSAHCAAAFNTEETPRVVKSIPVRDVHWRVALHLQPEKGIWLTRRPASGIWSGLWTPPITEFDEPPAGQPTYVHRLTHRRLHLYCETLETAPFGTGQWVADITKFALPTGIHHLLAMHGIK